MASANVTQEKKVATESNRAAAFKRMGKVGASANPADKQARRNTKMLLPVSLRRIEDSTKKIEETIGNKWRTILFILLFGLFSLGIGIGVIIYGHDTNLRDFVVLGGILVFVGAVLLLIAVIMVVYSWWERRKRAKVTNVDAREDQRYLDNLVEEYDLRRGSVAVPLQQVPAAADLYGTETVESPNGDIDKHDAMPSASVALPRLDLETPVYTIPIPSEEVT